MPSSRPIITTSTHQSITPSTRQSITPSTRPSVIQSSCQSITPSSCHTIISPKHHPTSRPSIVPSSHPSITPSSRQSITPLSRPSITPSSRQSIAPVTSRRHFYLALGASEDVEPFFDFVQATGLFLVDRRRRRSFDWFLLGQEQVAPPVGRVETPMADAVFQATMRMAHEPERANDTYVHVSNSV